MAKQKLNTASLTVLDMWRSHLLTKEKMKNYYRRKFYNHNPSFKWDSETRVWKKSVHEDLDCFLKNIRLGRLQENRLVTHFLPKLTEIELRLVEIKDHEHLKDRDLPSYMFFIYWMVIDPLQRLIPGLTQMKALMLLRRRWRSRNLNQSSSEECAFAKLWYSILEFYEESSDIYWSFLRAFALICWKRFEMCFNWVKCA